MNLWNPGYSAINFCLATQSFCKNRRTRRVFVCASWRWRASPASSRNPVTFSGASFVSRVRIRDVARALAVCSRAHFAVQVEQVGVVAPFVRLRVGNPLARVLTDKRARGNGTQRTNAPSYRTKEESAKCVNRQCSQQCTIDMIIGLSGVRFAL